MTNNLVSPDSTAQGPSLALSRNSMTNFLTQNSGVSRGTLTTKNQKAA
jgi:hypothetical protein